MGAEQKVRHQPPSQACGKGIRLKKPSVAPVLIQELQTGSGQQTWPGLLIQGMQLWSQED